MAQSTLSAGVDEVGRGPLAGPVIAAAVILDPHRPLAGLTDSKKITEQQRNVLAVHIRRQALAWSIGRAEHHEIDAINILQASLLAMKRAIESLSLRPQHILVDGIYCPPINYQAELRAVVKGDSKFAEISAASILAKVHRDAEMVALDRQYPGYGFADHKGYPTKKHIAALQDLGISPIHRKSFGPVKKILHRNSQAQEIR